MILNYVEDKNNSEFYPTPAALVSKMAEKVDWKKVKSILEPSAGKGDIINGITQYKNEYAEVDAIEYDSNLRSILKYNFSEAHIEDLNSKKSEIIKAAGIMQEVERRWNGRYEYFLNGEWNSVPESIREKLKDIDEQIKKSEETIRIVHDDFLTYKDYKRYDLIIMNPPFSNGDKHLLKAINMMRFGGQIVCLLNAETIRNPYTQIRKELAEVLEKYEVSIDYIDNEFEQAERKTAVEVALIYISIPYNDDDGKTSIYEHMAKAKEYTEPSKQEATELEVSDFIKAVVNRYNIEVESGIELINTYNRMKPYLNSSIKPTEYDNPILILTDYNGKHKITVNEYVKSVRYKYWAGLLSNDKFVGKLTSKLQEFYRGQIKEYSNYEFSEYNIYTLLTEMNASIKSGIEEEALAMYDRLTEEHSYYPECKKNRYLYNGWKTNLSWKLDKKSILPCYGVFSSWDGRPRTYEACNVLSDIERVLNFFAGKMTYTVSLGDTIQRYFDAGITKNIPLKYFNVTFYKKGTVHITYTNQELIDRFNIYAAQNKGWLPPSYGKKSYADMTAEEKEVIDSFQGKEAYDKVLSEAEYYLAAPTDNSEMMLLTA